MPVAGMAGRRWALTRLSITELPILPLSLRFYSVEAPGARKTLRT